MQNETIAAYQRELREKAESAIGRLRLKEATGTSLSRGDVDGEIQKLLPISEKYLESLDLQVVSSSLKLISDEIRRIFVPVDTDGSGKFNKLGGVGVGVLDESDLEDVSDIHHDFFDHEINQMATLGKLVGDIEGGKIKANLQVLVAVEPYLDLLKQAGLNVDYQVKITQLNGEELPEPFVVFENDWTLIKDLVGLIAENERASTSETRKMLYLSTKSILGRLQTPENLVNAASTKEHVRQLLWQKLGELSPQLCNLKNQRSLLDSLKALSQKKEKILATADVLLQNLDLRNSLEMRLGNMLTSFAEENSLDNSRKNKDTQAHLFSELRTTAKPVFEEIAEHKLPFSEKRNNLIEALRVIDSYVENYDRVANSGSVNKVQQIGKIRRTVAKNTAKLLGREISASDLENPDVLKKTITDELDKLEPYLLAYDRLRDFLNKRVNDFAEKYGLNQHFKDLEEKGKDSIENLTDHEIVEYILTYEIPFWTNLHIDSDNEFIKRLVFYVKYRWHGDGKGWENQGSKDGTEDDEWATLDGRTIMGLLKTFALYSGVLTGDPYAEGNKEELFPNLVKYRIFREGLLLSTTAHPIIGKFLSKVLEICQDWPTLRAGSLPKEADLNESRLRGHMSEADWEKFRPRLNAVKNPDGSFVENWRKLLLLNERYVVRTINGEEKHIKLAADRFVKDSKDHWVFYPGEETNLVTDRLVLEGDARFGYPTLSGNLGKSTAKDLQLASISLLESEPERFGLTEDDIPKGEFYRFAIKSFTQFLFYSFPFLTYIYAKYTEQTQTSAHPVDAGEINFYDLFSGFLGKAIQLLERYGVIDPLIWIFMFYKEFQDGIFGPSGKVSRMNEMRNLLVLHQVYRYGKSAMSHVVGRIDQNQFRNPATFTPVKMLTRGPNESVRFFGDVIDENGRIKQKGSKDNPVVIGKKDGTPAYEWSLFKLSANAFLNLVKDALQEVKKNSITLEQLKQSELNPLTNLFAKYMGQFKVWDLGSIMEHIDAVLFASIAKYVYSTKDKDPFELFNLSRDAAKKSKGDGEGFDKVSRGLGGGSSVEGVVDRIIEWLEGVGDSDRDVFRTGKEINPLKREVAKALTKLALGVNPPNIHAARISGIFATPSKDVFTERQDDLENYLKALWSFWSREFYTSEQMPDGLGPWPFEPNIISNRLVGYKTAQNPFNDEGMRLYKEVTEWFQERLMRKKDVPPPFSRPKFDKK